MKGLLILALFVPRLVLDTCVQCHDLHWITAQHKTEDAWRRTVNEMIWRGAPLKPGEADVIVKYLVAQTLVSVPAQTGVSAPQKAELPPGNGRDLVTAQCVQCHDLATTTSQRKTPAEWRKSVDEMVRLGAKLNGSESQLVARYLAHAFGTTQ